MLLRERLRSGHLRTLFSDLWYWLRDSTPERRRAHFGDLDYDFDHDVDTTASNLSASTRLAGAVAGAGYQPVDPDLLRRMLDELKLDFPSFTFIDIGSGKGRALLIASDYPFRRILGVELLPELHAIAQQNISRYHSGSQRCFVLESICQDARHFAFPPDPMVVYLFNPLPVETLRVLVSNLAASLAAVPRECVVLYANPVLEQVFSPSPSWIRISGSEQQVTYRFQPQ